MGGSTRLPIDVEGHAPPFEMNMADHLHLLKLILDGGVRIEVFVAWLARKLLKEATPEVLATFDKLRPDFVNFFLLYLREQAAVQIPDLQHSGLTPRKSVSRATDSPENVGNVEKVSRKPFSRMRLSFSHSQEPSNKTEGATINSVAAFDSVPVTSSGRSVRAFQRPRSSYRNSNESQNKGTAVQKSHHKLSLGQFITNSTSATVTEWRTPQFKNRSSGRQKLINDPLETKKSSNSANEMEIFNFKDNELFPPVEASSSIQRRQTSRRITPTPVTHHKNCLPGASTMLPLLDDNAAMLNTVFTNCPTNDQIVSLQKERELLKQERIKRQHHMGEGYDASCWSTSNVHKPHPLDANCDNVNFILVFPDQVLSRTMVIVLAELYSACIAANLVPCLMAEMYFLFNLLTVRMENCPPVDCDGSEVDVDHVLCSVANCVQFAVHVLWLQRSVLSLLDKGTLRLLLENPRLKTFSPQLCQHLCGACNVASSGLFTSGLPVTIPSLGSVTFQHDTDNRNNFVNDYEFHSFRRKRDLFYELLHEWEAKHTLPEWSATAALGERIRSLVAFGRDAASCSHLARLFQAQLMSMCKGDVLLTSPSAVDGPELLSLLKQTNPEKYKRLQERFVTPNRLGGPHPSPSFPGHQEFFKTFIVIAASHTFNQHLIDGFSAKIHEMNSFQLNLVGDGDWDEQRIIDGDAREQFLSCFLTLRLLAKFLGFVVFLPYQTHEQISETIRSSQIDLRAHNRPVMDIFHYLQNAIRSQRTILVIPWLVEFLSMMDPVAPLLPYYRQILCALFAFYRSDCVILDQSNVTYNRLLLLLLLGWLFEVINFKRPLALDEKAASATWAEMQEAKNEQPLPSMDALDSLALIDQRTLYTCCPYLGELRMLLSEFLSGISSKSSSVKKIKPVSTEASATMVSSSRQIELQLEENFFHNHPASLRRTVEFVAERISSNVVKHARRIIIPSLRHAALDDVKSLAASLENPNNGEVSQKWKMTAAKKVVQMSQSMAERACSETFTFAKKYCPPKSSAAISVLLPEETDEDVVDACVKIVHRSALKKVLHWTTTQITADVFHQELLHELQKLVHASSRQLANSAHGHCSFTAPSVHDEQTPSPADVLVSAKKLLIDLFGMSELDPSIAEQVTEYLRTTRAVISGRQDLTFLVYRSLLQMSVDLAVGLLIRLPKTMDNTVQTAFVSFWQSHSDDVRDFVQTLFCGRNFQHLQLKSSKTSWLRLESFALKLISAELISVSVLRERCADLLKLDWPRTFLVEMTNCLVDIVKGCQQEDDLAVTQLTKLLEDFRCKSGVRETVS